MTADRTEDRILVGNRFLDGRWIEHIPFDNGEACMLSSHKGRVACEGSDVVSLIQGLFNQAATSDTGSSKDHDMHNGSFSITRWILILIAIRDLIFKRQMVKSGYGS